MFCGIHICYTEFICHTPRFLVISSWGRLCRYWDNFAAKFYLISIYICIVFALFESQIKHARSLSERKNCILSKGAISSRKRGRTRSPNEGLSHYLFRLFAGESYANLLNVWLMWNRSCKILDTVSQLHPVQCGQKYDLVTFSLDFTFYVYVHRFLNDSPTISIYLIFCTTIWLIDSITAMIIQFQLCLARSLYFSIGTQFK